MREKSDNAEDAPGNYKPYANFRPSSAHIAMPCALIDRVISAGAAGRLRRSPRRALGGGPTAKLPYGVARSERAAIDEGFAA